MEARLVDLRPGGSFLLFVELLARTAGLSRVGRITGVCGGQSDFTFPQFLIQTGPLKRIYIQFIQCKEKLKKLNRKKGKIMKQRKKEASQ